MGELLDQFIIELKNLAKFLNIREVEPHHSPPYNAPRGFIGQASPSERPTPILAIPFSERTAEENKYLDRVQNPLYYARRG